jgi:hypothetical protein
MILPFMAGGSTSPTLKATAPLHRTIKISPAGGPTNLLKSLTGKGIILDADLWEQWWSSSGPTPGK